jgi:hypothetical protein
LGFLGRIEPAITLWSLAMTIQNSDRFFKCPRNHLIHFVFPDWQFSRNIVSRELICFVASALMVALLLAPFIALATLFFSASVKVMAAYIISCIAASALSIALAFRLSVVAFHKLPKPLSWVCPALVLSGFVPAVMLCFDFAESIDPAFAAIRAVGLNRSYFSSALVFLPLWIVPMFFYFKRLSQGAH